MVAFFAAELYSPTGPMTFMGATARSLASSPPFFPLKALFGKLTGDSLTVKAIADYMTLRLGERRAILAVAGWGAGSSQRETFRDLSGTPATLIGPSPTAT
jgi:hypothetical protein